MKPTQTLYILVALIYVVFIIQTENFDVSNKGVKIPTKLLNLLHKGILHENPREPHISY